MLLTNKLLYDYTKNQLLKINKEPFKDTLFYYIYLPFML